MDIKKGKKTNIITIRMDDDLKNRIQKQAKIEHREVAEFIRHTTEVYLEKIEEVRRITL